MDKIRIGVVGYGNIGTSHVKNIMEGKMPCGTLTALCDINPKRLDAFREAYPDSDVALFESAEEMFKSGLVDLVHIGTPHYSHTDLAILAMNSGLHCIVEKPAGVYTLQVKEMLKRNESNDKVLGIMFNQRMNPVFKKMREMVASGAVGEIKRTNWIITNWYRTQQYYDSGSWRATWAGEGGGVLYNQAPHQLDLFQWIVGMMPCRVRAFCHNGKWHDIEVEDDVTCYVEYPNGATGVFITTTADAPGTNRFEITGTKGKLVFDDDRLYFTELLTDEREHCYKEPTGFKAPDCKETVEIKVEGENTGHVGIFNNVINTILGKEELVAPADDGIRGVELANSMHLSSWLGKEITLPIDGKRFLKELKSRIKISKPHKVVEAEVEPQ